jgi:hypothetical protein
VAAKRPLLRLYWCSTPDHDEDWFVVGRSAAQARRLHENEEGYAAGDASAELVCAVPPSIVGVEAGWPSDALLRACGIELTKDATGTRLARYGGRGFVEGNVILNAAAVTSAIQRH